MGAWALWDAVVSWYFKGNSGQGLDDGSYFVCILVDGFAFLSFLFLVVLVSD